MRSLNNRSLTSKICIYFSDLVSRTHTGFHKIHTCFQTKMFKIYTLFQTKTAKKTATPFGAAHTYIA